MSAYPSGLRGQSAKLIRVGSNPTADSDIQPSRQLAGHPVQVVQGWLGCGIARRAGGIEGGSEVEKVWEV